MTKDKIFKIKISEIIINSMKDYLGYQNLPDDISDSEVVDRFIDYFLLKIGCHETFSVEEIKNESTK